MRFGVIDIGSNNIRMVVWEIYSKGYYRIIDELKESVRIGEDYFDPYISKEKMAKAITALKRFKKFSESIKVGRTVVVATEAVRRAPNQKEFLEKITRETGYEPTVLQEYEECYLDFKGVTYGLEVESALMVDIGGTSTELAWIKGEEMLESASLPIGTLNLTEKYSLEGIVNPKNHTAMEDFLLDEFGKIDWIKTSPFKKMVLVGGSARTIGRIDRHKKRYPLGKTHNYTLLDLDVHQLYYTLLTKDAHGRSKIDGLEKDRADIIMGALAIINTLISLTSLQEIRISGKGLREGILYEHIFANYERTHNMLDASIYSVLARHNMNVSHAEHIYKLTLKMFSELKNVHKIKDEYLDVVKTASLLHDVGMSVTWFDHEKHSFYIILNSELNGLNHKEILLSAYSAKYHRSVHRDLSMEYFSSMVNKLDLYIAEKIGILIALSECFDRNLNGLVYDVNVKTDSNRVTFELLSHEDISTEVFEAMKLKDKFEELYKVTLEINPVLTPQSN